jgi:hypothetical protein
MKYLFVLLLLYGCTPSLNGIYISEKEINVQDDDKPIDLKRLIIVTDSTISIESNQGIVKFKLVKNSYTRKAWVMHVGKRGIIITLNNHSGDMDLFSYAGKGKGVTHFYKLISVHPAELIIK